MRRLPVTTVIPDELYVPRAADRQLAAAITEMGRPPYILDPRQMGKTNLLLHARQSMEGPFLRFVYVDLSVGPSTLAEYYERLIDVAATAHPDVFLKAAVASTLARMATAASEFQVANLFQEFLRDALVEWGGRLVIVLDEIDALTGRHFSDRVFAQIRSFFFIHREYPEFKRLTYVLAGVAEPSKLIKNKAISPFNIGQKIFLGDFDRSEMELLLGKAGLPFGPEVVDRLLHWTSGNPRMVWEVASELEAVHGPSDTLGAAEVDEVVRRLFLTFYDRAPVDHVRTLVASDAELRAAVEALRAGTPLSESWRTALHLSGVATRVAAEDYPTFRSRIVEQALSDRWLREFDDAASRLLSQAREAFDVRRFDDSLRIYRSALEALGAGTLGKPDLMRLANAQFEMGRYSEALESYAAASSTRADGRSSVPLLRVARAHLAIGQTDEARETYESLLSSEPQAPVRAAALAALAALELDRGAERIARGHAEEALRIGKDEAAAGRPLTGRAAIDAALLIARLSSDRTTRVSTLSSAIAIAPPRRQIELLIPLARDVAATELPTLLPRIREAMADLDVVASDTIRRQCADAVAVLFERAGPEVARGAIAELAARLGETPSAATIRLLGGMEETAPGVFAALAIDLLNGDGDLPGETRRDLMTSLILRGFDERYPGIVGDYLDMVGRGDIGLNRLDHLALVTLLTRGAPDPDGARIRGLVNAVRGLNPPVDPVLRQSFLLVRYVQAMTALQAGELASASEFASDGLLLVEEARAASTPVVPEGLVMKIVEGLKRVLPATVVQEPFRNPTRRVGRNDFVTVEYRDGRRVLAKFKSVAEDLDLGACVMIG